MHTPSDVHLRQRKFFLVLPLLVLPFLTLAFWALGGGRGMPFPQPAATESGGLSLILPDPQFKKGKEQDKLSLYEQARRRLSTQATGREDDLPSPGLGAPELATLPAPELFAISATVPDGAEQEKVLLPSDPQEAEINQRLAKLSALAGKASPPLGQEPKASPPAGHSGKPDGRFNQDVDRLEAMMQRMESPGAPNPEMQQMEALLERILDIQHPERLKGQVAKHAPQEPPPAQVQARNRHAAITLLGASGDQAAGFYTLQAQQPSPKAGGNTVQAIIPTTQTLTPGAQVKLRLLEDMHLDGRRIPQGSLLYGTCRLRGERLTIEVSSVLTGKTALPVALFAYDLDGQEGLFIPGADLQEAARQEAGRALQQSLQLPSLSPSVGAQATSAGLAAARDMLNRRTRQVKVTVKAGHRLLLQNR